MIFLSIIFLFPTIFWLTRLQISFLFSYAYTIPMELANFSWHFFSDDVLCVYVSECVCVCVLAYSRFPMHHRSSIPVELRKWECVPMCASTDRQRAKEKKIVAVFLFLLFYSRVFFRCVEGKKRVKTSNECVHRLAMLICVNQAQSMYVIENL